MAIPGSITSLSGLAKRLVLDDIISEEVAISAVEAAKKEKTLLVSHLVQNKLADPSAIAQSASMEFGIPIFDLRSIDPDVMPKELIKENLIRQHHILPLLHKGNRLYIAISDPTNLQALDEIKFHTGITTESIIAEEDKLKLYFIKCL